MKTPPVLWLIAMLCLTACQNRDGAPGPGGVSMGEARALDEAAEMIEQRRMPPVLPDETAEPQAVAARNAETAKAAP